MLKTMPDAKVTRSTVGGREVTTWSTARGRLVLATGDLVFQIVADRATSRRSWPACPETGSRPRLTA